MVGILEQLEGGGVFKMVTNCGDKIEFCKIIASALQEQHWDMDVEQMFRAFFRGLSWGMKGESEEEQALHRRQWFCSLRLRRHSATKGFTSSEKSEPWKQA